MNVFEKQDKLVMVSSVKNKNKFLSRKGFNLVI